MSLRQWVLTALFVALVTVATMSFTMPVPATNGYINLGDTMIFVAALFLGPKAGFLAGGLGSALADLMLAPHWAPFTFVIKGLEGLLVALIAHKAYVQEKGFGRGLLAMAAGGAWMVCGYFMVETFLYGIGAALPGILGNGFQAAGSIVLATPVSLALKKVSLRWKTAN